MEYIHPSHKPCPDMTAWSLNSEQKQHGLEMLKKVRKELGEKQLTELRNEYKGASKAKQAKLQEQARHIEQVWC